MATLLGLYALLGLPPDASDTQVKRRYYQLVLELHPDKHPGDVRREEAFKAVTAAYNILSDSTKREEFAKSAADTLTTGMPESHPDYWIEVEKERASHGCWSIACDNDEIPKMPSFSVHKRDHPALKAGWLTNLLINAGFDLKQLVLLGEAWQPLAFILVLCGFWFLTAYLGNVD